VDRINVFRRFGRCSNALRVVVKLRRRSARELLFLVSVWLKGLNGLLELLGGAALRSVRNFV
jgi:hypothetical protein